MEKLHIISVFADMDVVNLAIPTWNMLINLCQCNGSMISKRISQRCDFINISHFYIILFFWILTSYISSRCIIGYSLYIKIKYMIKAREYLKNKVELEEIECTICN